MEITSFYSHYKKIRENSISNVDFTKFLPKSGDKSKFPQFPNCVKTYLVWKEILPTIWKPITCQVGVHAHVIGVRRQKIVRGAIEFFPLLAPFSILQIFVGSNHKINMRIVIPPRQVNCHLSWFVKGGMKRFRLN